MKVCKLVFGMEFDEKTWFRKSNHSNLNDSNTISIVEFSIALKFLNFLKMLVDDRRECAGNFLANTVSIPFQCDHEKCNYFFLASTFLPIFRISNRIT